MFLGALILIGLIAWVVISILLAMYWRVVVPTNNVHIVQTRKRTLSYGKDQPGGNVYYSWPAWLPHIGLRVIVLPVSVFDLHLNEYSAYDKGRVPFEVDILAFFRVEDPNTAAQRVSSFDELRAQLTGILQGASRSILALNPIEGILEKRGEYGEMFTHATTEQLKAWGVMNVKNIELMDIRDKEGSQVIKNIMAMKQSAVASESRKAVALNNQTALQAEIDAKRQVEIRQQEAEEQVGIRTAERTKKIGIAEQEAQQAIKEQAKTTAEKEMAVLQVQKVRSAEIERGVQVVNADQAKQVQIVKAEGEKQQTITVAEGNLEQARLHAQGVQLEGTAKGAAEQAVLMAPVNSQIALAKEIGENDGYQKYLLLIKNIEKDQTVGVEQAHALAAADIKVIANTGNVIEGAKTAMELFTSKGGTQLGGMLEALNQTDIGSEIIKAVAAKANGGAAAKK
jgi:flotillin